MLILQTKLYIMEHCACAVHSTNHCSDYSCYTLSQAYKMGPRYCFCCRNSQTDAKRIGPAEHFQIMTGQAYAVGIISLLT